MGMLIGQEIQGAMSELALVLDGMSGGQEGARAVRALLAAGRDEYRKRVEAEQARGRAEAALAFAQASIRAFLGNEPAPITEPPAGHQWVTGVTGGVAGPNAAGRLVCVTCTGVDFGSAVLAAECLAASQ
jgi:hypothetical protein